MPAPESIKKAVAENEAMIPAALAEIKGCIWCGPSGQFDIVRGAGPMWGHAVACSNCGGQGPGMADPMKAVSVWNAGVVTAEAVRIEAEMKGRAK